MADLLFNLSVATIEWQNQAFATRLEVVTVRDG
jgi:hypothetical protein